MHESLDREIQTLQSIFWSERDPDGLAFASLADAFRRKGEVREALDLLTDGMSRHPDFVTGHAVVTRLYRDQGMDFEAELAARRVLELDPENLVGLSVLTGVLADKGEGGEALRHRTTLMSVDPESEEARAAATLALEGEEAHEPEVSIETDPSADPAEITELVPETMYRSGSPDSLLDDLTLEEPGEGMVDPEVAEEELSLAMDTLGLVGEDEVPTADDLGDDDVDAMLPGPEMEFEGLDAFGPAGDEILDLGALAPDDEAEEPEDVVLDLGALAPDDGSEEPEDVVLDLGALAPDDGSEELEDVVMDLGALAPDDEAEELEDVVMDLGALAPDNEAEEPEDVVMDLSALAPDDEAEESEDVIMDLGALAPDEPEVVDLSALAPDDEAEEPEDVVMDLGALAPDEPEVVDLSALAPDRDEAESEDAVVDLAALAPDDGSEESEDVVMDLGALAPDEPEVVDLSALAPDDEAESEDAVVDLAALAPDEPEDVVDLAALEPDEPAEPEDVVMDLDALAPDEPTTGSVDEYTAEPAETEASDMKDEPAEPIYTRTLADLYIKQGFDEKALEVLKALQARHPDDVDLAERIATLEQGGVPEITLPEVTMEGNGHSEDDVETRARELAEHGREGVGDVDTPFAWNASADDGDSGDEPPAGSYFDQLLAWEDRAEP